MCAEDVCITVHLTLHSLWKQIDLYLQHKLVNPSRPSYPHKAYLYFILNSNTLEQRTNTEGFAKDIAGLFDVEADLIANKEFKNRFLEHYINGNTIEMQGTGVIQNRAFAEEWSTVRIKNVPG